MSPSTRQQPAEESHFSLRGRCTRSYFWPRYLLGMFLLIILGIGFKFTAHRIIAIAPIAEMTAVFNLLHFIVSVILLGPLVIRRMHDAGFSAAIYITAVSGRVGFLVLATTLPFIELPQNLLLLPMTVCAVYGWLATLVYIFICALVGSQEGSNDYGASPVKTD